MSLQHFKHIPAVTGPCNTFFLHRFILLLLFSYLSWKLRVNSNWDIKHQVWKWAFIQDISMFNWQLVFTWPGQDPCRKYLAQTVTLTQHSIYSSETVAVSVCWLVHLSPYVFLSFFSAGKRSWPNRDGLFWLLHCALTLTEFVWPDSLLAILLQHSLWTK